VIVLGDFDDTPDSPSIRFWTGRQSLDGLSVAYRDAWESIHPAEPGHTFSADNAPQTRAGEMSLELGRRVDYILVRCGIHGPTLDVTDSRRMLDQEVDGVCASDHYGVVADLAIPAQPPGAWA
jgi:endonuclease/exonuclease/phosphatase family metal-dependent hydrolase